VRAERARDCRDFGAQHFVCAALDESVSSKALEWSRPASRAQAQSQCGRSGGQGAGVDAARPMTAALTGAAVCRPRDSERPDHRKHCQPPHQPGVCPLSRRGLRHTALGQGNPSHRGRTSPPTKPSSWIASLPTIQTCCCITRPLIVPGSTKSKTGFRKSSATLLPAGVFESVADLRRKLMRYIKAYNKTATPPSMDLLEPNQSHRSVAVSFDTLH
jgi:hypothetical protein